MSATAGFWAVHGGHVALSVVPAAAMAVPLRRLARRADDEAGRLTALRASLATPRGQWRGVPASEAPGLTRRRAVAGEREGATAAGVGVALAATGTLAAAMMHVTVMPAHFRESWLYGLFFLVAAAVQVSWSLAVLRRPAPAVLTAGLIGSVSVVALWALTRTTALAPLGREGVGGFDIAATCFEVMAAIGAATALSGLRTPEGSVPAVRLRAWPPGLRAAAAATLLGALAVAFVAPVGA